MYAIYADNYSMYSLERSTNKNVEQLQQPASA